MTQEIQPICEPCEVTEPFTPKPIPDLCPEPPKPEPKMFKPKVRFVEQENDCFRGMLHSMVHSKFCQVPPTCGSK